MVRLGTWFIRTIPFVFLLALASTAQATKIDYSVTHLGGNQWRYDYNVNNNSLAVPILEFTVFFDRILYSALSVAASPVDWNSLVAQPDFSLPADGFFDSLGSSSGVVPTAIFPGGQLGGFSAQFDYLGSGTPGRQRFEIVDAAFNTIDGGFTGKSTNVPEPGGPSLALVGLALIVLFRSWPSGRSPPLSQEKAHPFSPNPGGELNHG